MPPVLLYKAEYADNYKVEYLVKGESLLKRLQPVLILLALSLIVTLFPQKSDAASKNTLSIAVNDIVLPYAEAIYRDNMIYVPMRAVFEAFGYEITYDHEYSSVEFQIGDIAYELYIHEEIIESSRFTYYSEWPFLLIKQKTYVPLDMFEDLFLFEIKLDEKYYRLDFQAMDAANDEPILALMDGYFTRSIEPKDLFHPKFQRYGSPIELYAFSKTVLEKFTELNIGNITYESLTEASLVTHYTSATPGVRIEAKAMFKLAKYDGQWRIYKEDYKYKNIFPTEDYDEKHQALLEAKPVEVNQVLESIARYYDAKKGSDFQAALNTYSPLYIREYNDLVRGSTWDESLAYNMKYPDYREDLLEAKVLYLDDQYAAAHVRVQITDLPQTYDGTMKQKDLIEPYEFEEILYLHHSDENRWTYYQNDYIDRFEPESLEQQ